jgi:diguanylate cyclase (GGDEF)-like protein
MVAEFDKKQNPASLAVDGIAAINGECMTFTVPDNARKAAKFQGRPAKSRQPDELERSYRKPFLDTLLHDSRNSLFHGLIGQTVSCWLFLVDTADPFYKYYIFVCGFVYLLRMANMKMYDLKRDYLMSPDSPDADIDRWYRIYMVFSCLTSSVVGWLGAYSIYYHPESWAAGVSLALTLGMMVAVVGRNYANALNVILMLICSFFPLQLAFFLYGLKSGNYVIGFGCSLLLIPFMSATRDMAKAVNKRYREGIASSRNSDLLSAMFFNAVSNMPNGLLLVTKSGEIKFANGVLATMFGLPERIKLQGKSVDRLFRVGIRRKTLSREKAAGIKASIDTMLAGASTREIFKLNDDLYIQFTVREQQFADLHLASDIESLRVSRDRPDGYVIVCEDVTQRIKSDEIIKYSANYDMLSEMPNRRHMRDLVLEAHASMGQGRQLAFCVFDVDKFKDINDTMGHAAGDEVIKSVGRSMIALKAKHPGLIISRLGGDEFVLAIGDLSPEFDTKGFFDKAFEFICKEYDILGKQVDVRCSGGVIVCSKQTFQLDDAFTKADLALYRVKQEKRERREAKLRWRLFDNELDQQFRNDQRLRTDLAEAVANGRMIVQYQPMYTPDGKHIDTCEALCRWDHPELGTVGPENFIPIAENMNLISGITKFIIETACRDCATWSNETCVSVNLSVLDLSRFEIVDIISDALTAAGLPATRLQVEITESIFLKDSHNARRILRTLNKMGVKTAIDDFGTGYSNLSYINELPLNKVKIDKSFIKNLVTDEKQRQLFEAIVGLGKKLNLGVVVEGVETVDQLEQINKAGVNLIQGFLFGRPMTSARVLEVLEERERASSDNKVISLIARHN